MTSNKNFKLFLNYEVFMFYCDLQSKVEITIGQTGWNRFKPLLHDRKLKYSTKVKKKKSNEQELTLSDPISYP